jgi:hypothetical protein
LTELSWPWIAVMLTAPPLAALVVAMACWRQGQIVLGNLAGTAVCFGAAIGLIMRERVALDMLAQRCLDAGVACWPQPSAFTRYAVYAFIALIEVFALFIYSLRVEARKRNERFAPEWRS